MTVRPLFGLLLLMCIPACSTPPGIPSDYRTRALDRAGAPPSLTSRTDPSEAARDAAPLEGLSLAKARDLSLLRNHSAAAARAAVDAAEAQISEARAAFLPTLSTSIRRVDNDRFRTVNFGFGEEAVSPNGSTEGSALLRIPLFAFGRDQESLRAAEARWSSQILDERSAHQELLRQVSASWYGIHEADAQIAVARDALSAAERQAEDARNLVLWGQATQDQELTAKVEVLRRRQELLVAENAVIHSRRVLNALLVRELDAPLTLAPPEPHVVGEINPSHLVALASSHNPSLLRYRAERKVLEHSRESVERSLLPEFDATLQATYTSFTGFGGFPTNYAASIGATWTPIDAGRRVGRLDEIHARLVELRERELDAHQTIELRIGRALLDLEETALAMDLATESIVAATENQRIVTNRFRGGKTTAREVLEADSTLSNARFTYNRSRFAYRIILANLEALIGVRQADWNTGATDDE
jgi:outer membrane protein TolC